jgi:hypothetical protein
MKDRVPDAYPWPLTASTKLRESGAWWICQPKWERELRLVLLLKNQLIATLKPPAWLLDMSYSVDPPSSTEDPRALTYPGTFLGPSHDPDEPADEMIGRIQSFQRYGCLSAPMEKPDDVIDLVDQIVRSRLTLMRPVEFYMLEDEIHLPARQAEILPTSLRHVLAELTPGVDVPYVYGTFRLSAELLIWMWRFYRELKDQRRAIQKKVQRRRQLRRLYQSLRTLEPYRDVLDPAAKGKILDLIVAYKRVKEPSADIVQQYRHRLGIFREPGQLKSESFWTPIVGWTVRQIIERFKDAFGTNRGDEWRACQVTASLLTHTFPRLQYQWTPAEVKARYSRSRHYS